DIKQLLKKIDGKEVTLTSGKIVLKTKGATGGVIAKFMVMASKTGFLSTPSPKDWDDPVTKSNEITESMAQNLNLFFNIYHL
ncbi:unnamed protein product, partial [marine sediment metagenome]